MNIRIQSSKESVADQGIGSIELDRARQRLQITQSHRTLPWLLATAAILLVTLWGEAPHRQFLCWLVSVCASTLLRSYICGKIGPGLDTAPADVLENNNRKLMATGLVNGLTVGSGFWWIGVGGSESVVFSLLLISCIYSIGSMINTSVHMPNFVVALTANMGQAVLFFGGICGATDLAITVSLCCVAILLVGFGRENAKQFRNTVFTRLENVALLERIAEEKSAVEIALLAARTANQKAERALVDKNRFVLAASHDLRNSLSALSVSLLNLGLVIEGDRARDTHKMANAATEGLREMLEAMLDLSALDAGGTKTSCSAFRIDDVLAGLVLEFGPKAQNKGLKLTFTSEPLTAVSDRHQVKRVLQNLVSNAINYTRTGEVRLSAVVENESIIVAVEDTGQGIATEDQARVFEDYVQLQNPARNRERGLGLGLAIVRRLDHLLGLRLSLVSTPGVGSKFSITLPRDANPVIRESEGDGSAPRPVRLPLRVWIIDDDARIREGLGQYLAALGCTVAVGASRGEMQRFAADGWPDLALIDDMLDGGENGLDMALWLCTSIPCERITIVTGNVDPARHRLIRDYGFRLVLKPLSEAMLLGLLGEPGEMVSAQQ